MRGNRSKGCARSTGSTWRANPIGAHLLFHPPYRFRPSSASPTCRRYRRYPRRRPRVSSRYRRPYRRGRPTPPEPNRLAPKCVASERPKKSLDKSDDETSSFVNLPEVNCGPFLTAFMCKQMRISFLIAYLYTYFVTARRAAYFRPQHLQGTFPIVPSAGTHASDGRDGGDGARLGTMGKSVCISQCLQTDGNKPQGVLLRNTYN